jgi:hypothetical protein
MRTSRPIAVTGLLSDAYVSPFIQIYLFIPTYMSALVDMMQEYKNKTEKCVVEKSDTGPALQACRPVPG